MFLKPFLDTKPEKIIEKRGGRTEIAILDLTKRLPTSPILPLLQECGEAPVTVLKYEVGKHSGRGWLTLHT